MKREIRSVSLRELRATKTDDGKQYLEGRAASYNVLSSDMGGWKERIMPGAFTRALKQDVRHLINHDANLVLGRTAAGTLALSEDDRGLMFRTELPDTSYARDLAVSVERGDVNESSFSFMAVNTAWVEEPDSEDPKRSMIVRELRDLDLWDISTVTYPAYPETQTELNSRAIPEDSPVEMRSRIGKRGSGLSGCDCACPECKDDNCDQCSNPDCEDVNCRCMGIRAAWKQRAEMRLRFAESA